LIGLMNFFARRSTGFWSMPGIPRPYASGFNLAAAKVTAHGLRNVRLTWLYRARS